MYFEYSCFLSYRHGQGDVMQGFMDQFLTALQSELELHSNLKPFIDKQRFSTGTILTPSIAQALCKSACMILIYTPRYFGEDSTYCTREFLAMQELARKRLVLVPDQTKSFILPVILRGKSEFPNQIFGKNGSVIFGDFEKFTLSERKIIRHQRFYEEVQKVAAHIVGKIKDFSHLDTCKDCEEFDFPAGPNKNAPPFLQSGALWVSTIFVKSARRHHTERKAAYACRVV